LAEIYQVNNAKFSLLPYKITVRFYKFSFAQPNKENAMKKILAIFAFLVLVFALFACGRDKNKNTTALTTSAMITTQRTTAQSSEITTAQPSSTTTKENPHPTETSSTTASQNGRSGTMPGFSSTPPTGTAPGGGTSVR
jgi:hypothetical protein